ncbi:uncharacterized protein F4822DRAFT_439310 [Hypoxylon trugodes]|uniref:uncharacterized protein n=1 Tax=Hypoxylon trugodes TaxID=326681 RepID=UPI00219FD3B0|nr:uncharacterized protein F4822DRAFT_439310 [Hypoxylon trugodes]KAI1382535.1 hypothetical protein F4822DRAFT_439310 [Hypoxylon trugodes]
MKNKSGLYISDLDLMLHHHWILDEDVFTHGRLRVQMAAALVLAGATSTCPGALIENLRYKDVAFYLFPPVVAGGRARVGMVITLTKLKRTGGISRPKKYGFHEEDTLLHDPVLYMESLALADNAFESKFVSPEELYRLVVPSKNSSILIPWKTEWQERYIFRDSQKAKNNTTIALDRAFPYGKARKYLIRKKLNKALSPEERNQSMGHTLGDSSTYVRFYMPDFIEVDFQEIIFGSEPQRDLIHLMGRLLRRGDAPKELTEEQKAETRQDTKLVRIRERRQRVLAKIRQQGLTLTTAKTHGEALLHQYNHYHKQAEQRKMLHDKRLNQAIQQFHDSADAEEIRRQLNGIRPSELLVSPTVQYQLHERAEVAKLFLEATQVSDRNGLYVCRIKLVKGLALLSRQQEKPRRRQADPSHKPTESSDLLEHVMSKHKSNSEPFHCPYLSCEGIIGGVSLQSRAQLLPVPANGSSLCLFCRWVDAERHIHDQYLRSIHFPFPCSFPGCLEALRTASQFAGHVGHQHALRLPPAVLSK